MTNKKRKPRTQHLQNLALNEFPPPGGTAALSTVTAPCGRGWLYLQIQRQVCASREMGTVVSGEAMKPGLVILQLRNGTQNACFFPVSDTRVPLESEASTFEAQKHSGSLYTKITFTSRNHLSLSQNSFIIPHGTAKFSSHLLYSVLEEQCTEENLQP
jgi:hypothetical protein